MRDDIHAEVCAKGFDADRNTFTQFYDSDGLDAALLLIPRVGFLPHTDPRVLGTIDAIQRELCVDGFVMRYHPQNDDNVDGLPGTEGAFLACTFWLVDALHANGRTRQAEELFERLLALRNDVGMPAEEYDRAASGTSATPRKPSASSAWSTVPASSAEPPPARRPNLPNRRPTRGVMMTEEQV